MHGLNIIHNQPAGDKGTLVISNQKMKKAFEIIRNHLAMKLYSTLHKLIGLHSESFQGLSTLEIKTMFVEFRGAIEE